MRSGCKQISNVANVLLQLRVLGFGLLQDGDVGGGVVPDPPHRQRLALIEVKSGWNSACASVWREPCQLSVPARQKARMLLEASQ
jgi:hypothetical protein